MTDLPSLIKRLEEATGPSWGLDVEIWRFHNPSLIARYERELTGMVPKGATKDVAAQRIKNSLEQVAPRYTSSIDAALTLVPEEWECSVDARNNNTGGASVCRDFGEVGRRFFCRIAATPALALCIAALRARGELTATERSE